MVPCVSGLLGLLLGGTLLRSEAIFLEIIYCQLSYDHEARLLICCILLTELLPGLFEVSGEVAKDVGEADQNGRAFLVLLHGVKVASDVSALHNLLSTPMVQRNFRKEAGYVEAQFFTLAEFRVEKYIAELSDGTRC